MFFAKIFKLIEKSAVQGLNCIIQKLLCLMFQYDIYLAFRYI